ncbi:MAG: hypothetical protein V1902_00155 [Candidatus Falkowbacteria bacterium]
MTNDKRKLYLIISVAITALLIFIFWLGSVASDFQQIDAGQKIGENGVKQEIESFFSGVKSFIIKDKQDLLNKYEKDSAKSTGI